VSRNSFESKDCATVLSYLDSYLSGELLVETNQDIINHLGKCEACSRALEDRRRVRLLLQRAVDKEPVPSGLEAKITSGIHGRNIRRWFGWRLNSLWIAPASILALILIALIFFSRSGEYPSPSAIAFSGRVTSDRGMQLVNVGLQDHISCAIDHKMKDRTFTVDQMKEGLGPVYSGLLSIVQQKIKRGYTVVVAHRCSFNGRDYIHFILKNDENKIVSVVLTAKSSPGYGVFNSDPKTPVPTVYVSYVKGYNVASFETKDYVGFVISDIGEDENMYLGFDLSRPIRDYLNKQIA